MQNQHFRKCSFHATLTPLDATLTKNGGRGPSSRPANLATRHCPLAASARAQRRPQLQSPHALTSQLSGYPGWGVHPFQFGRTEEPRCQSSKQQSPGAGLPAPTRVTLLARCSTQRYSTQTGWGGRGRLARFCWNRMAIAPSSIRDRLRHFLHFGNFWIRAALVFRI